MTKKNISGCVKSPVTRDCKLKSQVATLSHLVEWLKVRPALPNTDENVEPVEYMSTKTYKDLIATSFIIRSKPYPTVGRSVSSLQ